jgi:hypothetical protein
MTAEIFTFTQAVPCADADGVPIRVGSVLREITDGERGVVTRIVRAGQMGTPFDAVGDLHIKTHGSTTRCTNRYAFWRHIPHNDQTYAERFLSWKLRPYDHDTESSISRDEGCAAEGIMALLPDDLVNWDYGPFPDRLEDALQYLAEHLTTLAARDGKEKP